MNAFLQRQRDAVRCLNISYRAQHWCFLWSQHLSFPKSPLFKGLKGKEINILERGEQNISESQHLLERFQVETHKSRYPESLEDGSGIFCSPGYVPPPSHMPPLSHEVKKRQDWLQILGHWPPRNLLLFVFHNDCPLGRRWPSFPPSS